MADLTAKQQRFVHEYIIDLNATQAAIRAGYSKKTSRQMGSENLSKPYIQEALEVAILKRIERCDVTADEVVSGLRWEAMYGNASGSRVAAWGWLGKHLAMFTDKVQHDGKLPEINITVLPEGEPVNRIAHLTNGDGP